MQETDCKYLEYNDNSHELQHENMQNEMTNLAQKFKGNEQQTTISTPTTPKIKTKTTSSPPKKVQVPEKKKSSTAILCELTHLKSQQKYLECSQVKLNADHFIDLPDTPSPTPKSSPVHKTQSTEINVAVLINDIENLKLQLDEELKRYKEKARTDVQDFGVLVHGLKEDVFRPERLQQLSVQTIRERVIVANGQLEKLQANNTTELTRLKEQFVELEVQVQRLTNSF